MEVDFCLEAAEEALARYVRPEIFNTDQGSQFTSAAFTGLLLENERWLAKFGQVDKWNFCLRAARVPRVRRDHDETSSNTCSISIGGSSGVLVVTASPWSSTRLMLLTRRCKAARSSWSARPK